ncbi:General transcription and DNA repair factor IIH helicase subunit XPD (TFIIH subunit XPD) (ERCC2 homolog) (RAD3 homolog) (UV hypersensitive protein 6) (AtUVH6) (XPD homolog) (AtXPD) [Durusdinium trenchii]|uniref:DNA 5'-3' helicase n=1 Tax=Durusdinium trenchii TaxID=1381693 RepID=A0ABP0L5C3_9DINO
MAFLSSLALPPSGDRPPPLDLATRGSSRPTWTEKRSRGAGAVARCDRASAVGPLRANPAALQEVLAAAGVTSGWAMLLIPRRLLSEAAALAQEATRQLPNVQIIACITGGPTVQLGAVDTQGSVAFALQPDTLDSDLAAACGPGGPPSSLLLFGDPAITAPALARSLDALEKVLATPSVTTPKVTGVGGLMAAPAEKGQPAVWVNGTPVLGGFAALRVPQRTAMALDLVGCSPVGEELEIFEASVQRGKAPEILQIGTDQEGDYRDVAETEKGTAGIPRRVGIPAAAALKAVMQREQIAGPKELLLGLSRPAAMGTSLAEKWALFNWVGVSKAGGCALAGGDPITEKLMPKGTLQSCQCFKVSPALEQWRRLAAQGASLTLALAGGRNLSPQQAAATVGNNSPALGALGVSVLGKAGPNSPLEVHRQAHNIDDVCIESLSVKLNRQRLDQSSGNLTRLGNEIERVKKEDASRLQEEYKRLVQGLRQAGQIDEAMADQLQSPVLPEDLVSEAIPGNIRRAEHFIALLRRIVNFCRRYLHVERAQCEGPLSICHKLEEDAEVDSKSLKFCHERLRSLLNTLQVSNLEEFTPITKVADFVTLLGTYSQGFTIIVDPYPEAQGIYDPTLILRCLDASIAIRPVLKRYQSVVLTSGTISPLEMYPKILGMSNVVATESFSITMERKCLCPLIVTHGPDQVPISSRFSLREDPSVVQNYGSLLEQLVQTVPDGLVCFFTSYRYLEQVLEKWYETGVISRVLKHKLLFIETADVVATTYALNLYRQACDSGQGAVFLSVARGKVAEGIDFDRHYGRCVVLFGVPFQYTLSRELRARLEFLRQHYDIKESEFLNFDAMRQASQCLGRVIRSKRDYGVMIFADQRYARSDKRSKIPDWIRHFLEPGHVFMASDLAVEAAGNFLLQMSQPFEPRTLDRVNHEEKTGVGASVLTPQALQELQAEDSKASDSKEMEKSAIFAPPLKRLKLNLSTPPDPPSSNLDAVSKQIW